MSTTRQLRLRSVNFPGSVFTIKSDKFTLHMRREIFVTRHINEIAEFEQESIQCTFKEGDRDSKTYHVWRLEDAQLFTRGV